VSVFWTKYIEGDEQNKEMKSNSYSEYVVVAAFRSSRVEVVVVDVQRDYYWGERPCPAATEGSAAVLRL